MTHHHDAHSAPIDDTIDRGLVPDATAQDSAHLAQWTAASAAREHFVEGLRRVVQQPGTHAGDHRTPIATDAAWAQLAERIAAAAPPPQLSAPTLRLERPAAPSRSRWASRLIGIAAALAVVSVSYVWWNGRPYELVAPRGQRISATLPDGSTLLLAAGSRARWPRAFGDGHRTVTLEGEAWFDVVHDDAHPFRVRAAHVIAEDIGTRFVVRAWGTQAAVEVAVEEGIVALTDSARQQERAVLRAGQRAYAVQGRAVVVSDDAQKRLAWTTGTLDFDNASLREAANEIERWYNVTVNIDRTLQDRRVSARFERQPLPQLLQALALALSVRIENNGDVITIAPR